MIHHEPFLMCLLIGPYSECAWLIGFPRRMTTVVGFGMCLAQTKMSSSARAELVFAMVYVELHFAFSEVHRRIRVRKRTKTR